MLNNKKLVEELDENNQKQFQNIFGKFLYYARVIDPKMLTEITSMAAVHIKPTIDTAKQITPFLNYIAYYPDAVK